jgi:hypothetical protein
VIREEFLKGEFYGYARDYRGFGEGEESLFGGAGIYGSGAAGDGGDGGDRGGEAGKSGDFGAIGIGQGGEGEIRKTKILK